MGQRMSHHPIQNPRANQRYYIKRMLLEDDNDFAQLLSSTGFHKSTRKPSICASFAEKKKCILVCDNRSEMKLKEVVSVPVAVGEDRRERFGVLLCGFIAAQGLRIRVQGFSLLFFAKKSLFFRIFFGSTQLFLYLYVSRQY